MGRWIDNYRGNAYGYYQPDEIEIMNAMTHDWQPESIPLNDISKCRKCGQRVANCTAAFTIGACPNG
jgi:hypothetical protein